jgi:transcriptional regulator of acetoin/glycerol metabolism
MVSSMKAPDALLRKARHALVERGQLPNGLIHDLVARSWRRSFDAGLAPTGSSAEAPYLDASELAHYIEPYQELIANARPMMEYLYSQTRDSGVMVVLSDKRGVLLHVTGDAHFMTRAERVSLAPGASWHEHYRGTNAIGTALAEAGPVVVHGAEHYLERNGFLACSAAPIVGPHGDILGVLDVSSAQQAHHPHTLALVRAAAHMIENRLFSVRYGTGPHIRFHPMAEGIGTLAEGVAAISWDGRILAANHAGLAWLDITPADLGIKALEDLLDVRMEALVDREKRHTVQAALAKRAGGGALFVRMERGEPPLPKAVRPISPSPEETDELTALDTGDPCMRAAIGRVRRILGKPIPLLLQGDTGVGKEVFARAVHQSGLRRTKPFVAVNCAALPEALIEAELFGYMPGAFTGARRDGALGRIREACGGTLLLDEIGDMPLALQGRLLRVLEDHEVVPLGGGRPVTVDFALICATHRDLKIEVDAGRFRDDLYYRINALTIRLPCLRERSDFDRLVTACLERIAPGRGIILSGTLMRAFRTYDWPGNLRQMACALRTACALLDTPGTIIDWPHLPDDLARDLKSPSRAADCQNNHTVGSLRHTSNAVIHRTMEALNGNKSEAARRLGISRSTLYRRIKS